jgi:peptide/nickel transport system substrate-binding protein
VADDTIRNLIVNRRRFMQLGASMLALPLVYEATSGPAGASVRELAAAANPKAVLNFGEMQGQDYDPIIHADTEFFQLYAIFDTLVSYKSNGTLIPRLATSWQASSDKVRMSLRPGVTFQDGTPMDAAAVAFSLNRVLTDRSSTVKSEVPMLGSVSVVDSQTIDLLLTENAALSLLFQLGGQVGMIVSPTAVK